MQWENHRPLIKLKLHHAITKISSGLQVQETLAILTELLPFKIILKVNVGNALS